VIQFTYPLLCSSLVAHHLRDIPRQEMFSSPCLRSSLGQWFRSRLDEHSFFSHKPMLQVSKTCLFLGDPFHLPGESVISHTSLPINRFFLQNFFLLLSLLDLLSLYSPLPVSYFERKMPGGGNGLILDIVPKFNDPDAEYVSRPPFPAFLESQHSLSLSLLLFLFLLSVFPQISQF
jgi:hypothetical protein